MEVGGDFFDVFAVGEEDEWALVIGDVCGKGARRRRSPRWRGTRCARCRRRRRRPRRRSRRSTTRCCRQMPDPRFLSAAARPPSRSARSGGASGRSRPAATCRRCILRADGTPEVAACRGMLLGVEHDARAVDCAFALGVGDALVLYTGRASRGAGRTPDRARRARRAHSRPRSTRAPRRSPGAPSTLAEEHAPRTAARRRRVLSCASTGAMSSRREDGPVAHMSNVTCQISISLDGFVAGPNQSIDNPIGEGGMRLHQWAFATDTWHEQHGSDGGERTADSLVAEEVAQGIGAYIMGRNMFGPGAARGTIEWRGWWGEDPPYHTPVYVLTHHEREPLRCRAARPSTSSPTGSSRRSTQARAAAGEQDVSIAGGASTVRQYLRAGLLDELYLHIVPVVLGRGERLLEDVGDPTLEPVEGRRLADGDAREVPGGALRPSACRALRRGGLRGRRRPGSPWEQTRRGEGGRGAAALRVRPDAPPAGTRASFGRIAGLYRPPAAADVDPHRPLLRRFP
jgi:dihydrofolate reductase